VEQGPVVRKLERRVLTPGTDVAARQRRESSAAAKASNATGSPRANCAPARARCTIAMPQASHAAGRCGPGRHRNRSETATHVHRREVLAARDRSRDPLRGDVGRHGELASVELVRKRSARRRRRPKVGVRALQLRSTLNPKVEGSIPSRPMRRFGATRNPHGYSGQACRGCRRFAWRAPTGAPTIKEHRRQPDERPRRDARTLTVGNDPGVLDFCDERQHS
jgi:hypothetical protein